MLKRNAFTLAEVLITLGIIGVVAAMTLPTLLTNTQQQTFRAQLKKSLTVLSQAASVNLAIDDYDPATAGAGTGASSMYQIYKNRTNVLSTGTAQSGAWPTSGTGLNNGTLFKPNDKTHYIFNYNDGSSFLIQQAANNGTMCRFTPTTAQTDPLSQTTADITSPTQAKKMGMCVAFIDVNGPKGPNTIAKCDVGSGTSCKVTNAYDVFPVLVDGSNLYLATPAAKAFYQNKK